LRAQHERIAVDERSGILAFFFRIRAHEGGF
jgi:hypothetical protein